jgi:putative heme degradation protein
MGALFHQAQRDAEEMQMRIGIGMAVVVAIGLIWSVAAMSEWVPVVSAG